MKYFSSSLFWLGTGIGLGVAVHRLFGHNRPLLEIFGPSVLRWIDRGKSDQDLVSELNASGMRINQQLSTIYPSKKNYALLRHIIGIEKWGQNRLAVALGEPFVADEYNDYRPARDLSWNELQDQFTQVRAQTVAHAEAVRDRRAGGRLIPHNSYGDLTPAMWMTFLRVHADIELRKMN